MANIKPTLWKVIASLVAGIIISLFGLFLGWREYAHYNYKITPLIPDFSLINQFFINMIWGFVFGVITIYLIYSLFQNEKSKWMLMKLFGIFLVVVVVYFMNMISCPFNNSCIWDNNPKLLFGIYDVFLLIYIGIKYMTDD